MKDLKFIGGIFLIALGALGIILNLFNINIISGDNFWPFIIIAIGVCFEYIYFSTKKYTALLLPAGILITIGILFVFEELTNWYFAAYTWPIYPLAVAIGLFQVYIFGKKQPFLLLPIGILLAVTVFSFANMIMGSIFRIIRMSMIIPVALLIIGIIILVQGLIKKEN